MKLLAAGMAALALAGATRAQEFLDVPLPRVSSEVVGIASPPKQAVRKPWWKLDKDVTVLGAVHAAAATMDGITTRRCISTGMTESDPLDRLFLGPRPTWSRMIPLGSLEIYGAALLAQQMKHSKYKVVRKLYLGPQIFCIGIHTYEGGRNVVRRDTLLQEGY